MPAKLTTETFLKQAVAVHGDKYDYSESKYINSTTSLSVVCPDHGAWDVRPANHIHRKSGCPACAGLKKLTTEEFITRSRFVHGYRYDYSKSVYKNAMTPLTVTCLDHGDWQSTPVSHYGQSKSGCPKCAGNVRLTTEEWIARAKEVHGDRFGYSRSVYPENNKCQIEIECFVHGFWWTDAATHVNAGSNCPSCAHDKISKETAVYLVWFEKDSDSFFKIGITDQRIQNRFSHELSQGYMIRIVDRIEFAGRVDAKNAESFLHESLEEFSYEPKQRFPGWTECFDVRGELFIRQVFAAIKRGQE